MPEGNPLRGGRRGKERDRAGHERRLEKAIPVSTRQRELHANKRDSPNLGSDSKESTERRRVAAKVGLTAKSADAPTRAEWR